MKRHSALLAVIAIFGGISAYEVLMRFGWQAVDLSPIAFWLYSFGVAVRNWFTYTCIFLAIPFLLGRACRFLLAILATYLIIIEFAVVYAGKVFHADLASVWLDLIRDTSIAEIRTFVIMAATPLCMVSLIGCAIVLVASVVWLIRASYPALAKKNMLFGVLLLFPFAICNLWIMNWHWGVAQMRYSAFTIGTYMSWRDMRGVHAACSEVNLPHEIETTVAADALPDVVFIIGESATRNNWNLYGYPRSTSPRMNDVCRNGGGTFYTDVVGTQPATVAALSMLLTDVEFDNRQTGNWTLAEVCRRAGYRCVLISNQYSWGDSSSILYQIFNGCEKRISMSHEFPAKERVFDTEMLSFVKKEFAEADHRPVAMFIHLSGMHYPVQNINPLEDDFFNDSVEGSVLNGLSERDRDRCNRYDNGIRFEDKVLGMIVDALAQRERPCCMFFCSDHGESPRSPGWRDYSDDDVYEIPVVFWFSEEYKAKFPTTVSRIFSSRHRELQQDQLTIGLLHLYQIKHWDGGMRKKDFLCDEFNQRCPRVVEKGRRIYVKGGICRKLSR